MGSIVGSPKRHGPLRFDRFELDRSNARLLEEGRAVALRPKTFAVLAYLVERPGRLVRKDELLDAVWAGTAVTDTVLKVCVREAREALGDDPSKPRFIETAHRLGYRFIAPLAADRLPAPVESFVGRTKELRALEARLQSGARLLTLTGPGGCGKTSLALELARRLVGRDEVYWVELEALREPPDVFRAIASAVSVREQRGTSLENALGSYFAARGGLLFLDNCEHLIEVVARLTTALLRRCAGLRIVATSRESLRTPGEHAYPVPSLSDDEATALFIERARASSPELEPVSSRAITELCSRLDGLPLAIELAATAVRTHGVEALSRRLAEGDRLLELARRDTTRHRSLGAAIDWSHDTLSPGAATLFRRLGVFAGSFGVEAVDTVAAAGATEAPSAELGGLVERSLVVASGDGRFRLLETLRHYAREKLRDAGEERDVNARFVDHFAGYAEAASPSLNGPERRIILHELDRDHPNFVRALRLSHASDYLDATARITGALVWFWFHQGYWIEGREHLARAAQVVSGAQRARVLFGSGFLAWASGDSEPALSFLEESARSAREQNDTRTLAYARVFLGMAFVSVSRLSEGRDAVASAVEIFRADDDVFGTTVAVTSLGIAACAQESYDEAVGLLEEGAAMARASGDLWLLALATRNLGIVALRRGDLDRAVACLRESLDVQDADGEKWFLSRSLEMLAAALALSGDSEPAAVLFGAGEALRELLGAAVLPMYRADHEKGLAAARASLEPAELERLWSEGRVLDTANLWKRAGL